MNFGGKGRTNNVPGPCLIIQLHYRWKKVANYWVFIDFPSSTRSLSRVIFPPIIFALAFIFVVNDTCFMNLRTLHYSEREEKNKDLPFRVRLPSLDQCLLPLIQPQVSFLQAPHCGAHLQFHASSGPS